jgi:hypothetical protein
MNKGRKQASVPGRGGSDEEAPGESAQDEAVPDEAAPSAASGKSRGVGGTFELCVKTAHPSEDCHLRPKFPGPECIK